MLFRRILLVLAGLAFVGFAVYAVSAPVLAAAPLGYQLATGDAIAEFRGVYFGAWLGIGALMFLASWRAGDRLLGDICGLIILGQPVGRLVSAVIERDIPGMSTLPMLALYTALGLGILMARRGRPAPPSASSAPPSSPSPITRPTPGMPGP